MTTSSSPSGRPYATYTEARYWRVRDGSGRLVKITLLALPLAAVFGLGFVWMAKHLGKAPKLAWDAGDGVVFVIGIFCVLALHECTHGLLMRAFGARPRYGFYARGGLFYAKAPGYTFTRRQYLIVVLGPLIGLSLLACAGIGLLAGTSMVWYVALWGVVNASAANADSWIAGVVLQLPADGIRPAKSSCGSEMAQGCSCPRHFIADTWTLQESSCRAGGDGGGMRRSSESRLCRRAGNPACRSRPLHWPTA